MSEQRGGEPSQGVPFKSATATAIGSLPHVDPREAARFSIEHHPALPAAPQLPTRSLAELMLAQSSTGADLTGDGWLSTRVFLDEAAKRGTKALKLQMTGPITAGLAQIADGAGAVDAFRAAAASARAQGAALVALAQSIVPDAQLVVFLDEPGLTSWGEQSFPLTGGAVEDLLAGALGALGRDVVTGVHCCGPTDLALIIGSGPDIISSPIGPHIVEAAGTVCAHLDRGGWVAWGAVPTDRPIGDTVDPLWRHLAEIWCGLAVGGCDPVALRRQSLITPVCGLAGHRPEQASRVLRLTNELSDRAHSQALAARLSVGA